MTKAEAIICSAYTGTLFPGVKFDELHEAIEERLNRLICTHEMVNENVIEEIKLAFKADFLAMEVVG